MANSILTPTAVTREIQRVLHEKLSFIGSINRSYDDSFARTGAKIGDSLKIRLPNKYTVRTGKNLNAQDTQESSVTLTVANQAGVDMNFSSAELTMEMDDFSKRIIEPAMAQLASYLEYQALTSVTKEVYNLVGTAGTTPNALSMILDARAKLNQYLAPKGDRHLQLDSVAMASLVNALSSLQNDPSKVSQQYREGAIMTGVAGFDRWFENERIYVHTNDSDVSGITLDTVTLADGDSTAAITGASAAPAVGSVFTFATGNAVHPETKQSYGHLQQFVVTAATTSSISFSPPIYASGAKQNVSVMPGTTSALTFVGSASTAYEQHLAYHKDAFAFATADLEVPQGVHFAARETYDGVSIRVVRQYDISSDNYPCRIDVLYGYKTIRPELACRITG